MAKRMTATETVAASGYSPTKKEAAALERYDRSRRDRRKFPPMIATTDEKGTANIKSEHPDELVAQVLQSDALGIVDNP